MTASINIDEIDEAQRKAMGLKKPRESKFNQEDVRRWAIKVLGVVAGLSQSERSRVLRHALRVNDV